MHQVVFQLQASPHGPDLLKRNRIAPVPDDVGKSKPGTVLKSIMMKDS